MSRWTLGLGSRMTQHPLAWSVLCCTLLGTQGQATPLPTDHYQEVGISWAGTPPTPPLGNSTPATCYPRRGGGGQIVIDTSFPLHHLPPPEQQYRAVVHVKETDDSSSAETLSAEVRLVIEQGRLNAITVDVQEHCPEQVLHISIHPNGPL